MYANSRAVTTAQQTPHPGLHGRLSRMLSSPWRQPLADHSITTFAHVERACQARLPDCPGGLILDSGCGVGLSTRQLAERHADALVIGIDRSHDRLSRGHGALPDNALLVRADLGDFWRLAYAAGWQPVRHYLLYPNPYPKAGHLKRRWQGHPVFPTLVAMGGRIELRSNWSIYVEEFASALAFVSGEAAVEAAPFIPEAPYLTPFERKYHLSGQSLWRCVQTLPWCAQQPVR